MDLQDVKAVDIRRIVLEESKRANVGHVGSCLCIADILAVLYGKVLRIPSLKDGERDRFILSKGHAALALYAVFCLKGWLDRKKLKTFCAGSTALGVHPDRTLEGVDFCTGSLGMGLSFGAGAALAARLQDSPRRVFVLLSDAECNEGSVWETAMFAAQKSLANLTAIVDFNGQQAVGYTKDVIDLSNSAERWRAFGWDVHEADGHDIPKMQGIFENLNYKKGKPHILIAHTTFGKGVSYMENKIKWHYYPMSDPEYQKAIAELETQ